MTDMLCEACRREELWGDEQTMCWRCRREHEKKEVLAKETRSAAEIDAEVVRLYEEATKLQSVLQIVKEKEALEQISQFDKEWLEGVKENREKIKSLVASANRKMMKAIKIADEFAIPFHANYLPKIQQYVPFSFRKRKIDKIIKDGELFDLLLLHVQNHTGWEMSGPPR